MTKCAAFAALLFAVPVFAQEAALAADPSQTQVEFTLGDVVHTVHGHFNLKRGGLRLDSATGKLSGELVIDATSGDSGSTARDRRMHKDVLESARYSEVVFRPDRFAGRLAPEGISQVQVHGMFTIHGAAHEITVPAQVEASGSQYRVTARFSVPYTKWGMKNPSMLFLRVGDKVELTVNTVLRPVAQVTER
jgi:polyisoprenoid-binding protein YceI